jgi:hypothetical protein
MKETNTMKVIFTGTLAAFVLGAAIASSQTPAGQGQTQPRQPSGTPSGDQKSGTQQSGTDRRTTGARAQTNENQTSTYRGYLRRSAAEGWTISPIGNRTAGRTSGNAGASANAVGTSGEMQTYSVMAGTGSKIDLAKMADQCVEIVGSLSPETGMSSSANMGGTNAPSGAGAAGGANSPAGAGAGASANAGERTPDAGGQGATTPGAGGNPPSNASGNMSGHNMHRTLTVTRIRAVQGGCTQ